jgi:hypothetical protein
MSDVSFAVDLLADAAHPDLADRLTLFGRFVGAWHMRVRFYEPDGRCVYDEPGRWTFGWVLDGRAVQDVLTGPHPDGGATDAGHRRIGSSMRMLDPATGGWHVVWFGASSGSFVVLSARADGDGILLESEPEEDGTINRWRFDDITDDGFSWTGHESRDGGHTWVLRQRMEGTRVA